jgi:hypothetical protein
LLLISFIVVFAFSYSWANQVTFENKANFPRCETGVQNITVNPSEEITAFEIVFVINSASGGAWVDPVSITWAGGVPTGWYKWVDYSKVDGATPDTIRMAAGRLAAGLSTLAAGPTVVATLGFTTNNVCDGNVTVGGSGVQWTGYVNPTGPIVTQFTDVDANLLSVAVTTGTIDIENADPTIDPIPNDTIHWGDYFTYTAVGHDDDIPNGCEKLRYSLTVKPATMTIDSITGKIEWTAPGSAVCDNPVTVRVTDSCGAYASTSFSICVQNDPPMFTCDPPFDSVDWDGLMCEGDTLLVGAGEEAHGQVQADDPDHGPYGPFFSVLSWEGQGTVIMDPGTGEFTWQTVIDYANPGDFVYELVVKVTDSANTCACSPENADTMSVFIEVVPLRFYIEKLHDVIQGQFVEVDINMPDSTYINHPMGGFDFLIQYDNSGLTMMGVEKGEFIDSCGWEYFTYRTGPWGNCGNACPSGMIKIVAIAEYNNGANHPDCFNNDPGIVQLAKITFLVTNDRTFECQFLPIRFIWIDCTDNTVSNVSGEELFIGRRVFDYYGEGGIDGYVEITPAPPGDDFPTIYGPPWYCDTVPQGKPPIYRYIDFFNGGVDIICGDSIDARGDLNMDGVPYSIADAVMYSNYFVYGMTALVWFPETGYAASIAASDCNADGLTLTVGDLVYLVRVVVGDAQPYPKEVAEVNVNLAYSKDGTMAVDDKVAIGAVRVVYAGDVTPNLLAEDMEMQFNFDGENTNVFVWSRLGNSFTGPFISANADVVVIEMATAEGYPVTAKLIPTEFDLAQNYPNPFNPATTIEFEMPVSSNYILTIYNITGQVVETISGSADAGLVSVVWNADSYSSGLYFYKLTAGDYTATKKMVLLK